MVAIILLFFLSDFSCRNRKKIVPLQVQKNVVFKIVLVMKKENTLGSRMKHPEGFKLNQKNSFAGADRQRRCASNGRKRQLGASDGRRMFGANDAFATRNFRKRFNEVESINFRGENNSKAEGRYTIENKFGGEGKFKAANKNGGFDNKKFGTFDSSKHDRHEQRKKMKENTTPKPNEQRRPVQPSYNKTQFVDYSKPMRLNRFLANAGVCSRREADDFIRAGVVTVNGQTITELGTRVVPAEDKVMFHDQLVKIERRVYILLNKPKDYVTTADDPHAKQTVMDLVKGACSERLYPVGRLDRNTTGVLLLTNDGELTAKLTHPSFNKKKVYQVTLDKDVSDDDVQKITTGITLEDGDIKVDEFGFVKEGDRKTVGVEIHSGRNRIVRRIFESLGYRVVRLDRVFFAGLTKKNLPRGKWRFLSEKEVVFLKMNANNPYDI